MAEQADRTPHHDEHALVAAAAAGDRAAMDTLLRRHYDRIHAVCRRITGSDADAADAAQEALISIVRNLHKFDGRSSFGTWAYRIATNASLDELRRRRRRPVVGITDGSDGHDGSRSGGAGRSSAEDHDQRLADPDSSRRTDLVVDRMALDQALRAVPEEFRVPMVMRDVGDLDYAEIAETLGIPVGTVKSRIARGRAALGQIVRAGNRDGPDERPNHDPPPG